MDCPKCDGSLRRVLIDQERARVIVPPLKPSTGFWFGGGNLVESPDGTLYLSGRYRTYGDSRTGLHVGERGLELAIFESCDRGQTFDKLLSWSKRDLSPAGQPVALYHGGHTGRQRAGPATGGAAGDGTHFRVCQNRPFPSGEPGIFPSRLRRPALPGGRFPGGTYDARDHGPEGSEHRTCL